MKSIGGFFELELPHGGARPHPGALGLSTGRACLMVMLENLRPRRVHVPFYTCDAALEPFARMGIETRSYGLEGNPLPLRAARARSRRVAVPRTDYFGTCAGHTQRLKELLDDRLLIDDTHNFFSRKGHRNHWSFTSARKYFGVPDGSVSLMLRALFFR